ncbi:MAG: phage tail sheath family protein [Lachnospiraceae bacterium]|nr:phage tail sheath family protein [Lachnospiraceae bacterium]
MAEYLSPGVYVEEFDSGATPMEGVGTSTAGFVGLAQRGPVQVVPQLVTNYADFGRIYGGHLSANEFGDYRFLSYAVESFFVNGGARCYVMRVAPSDAKAASGSVAGLSFTAKNPGLWGDDIRISFAPASKAKTQVLEIQSDPDGKKYRVKNSVGFNAGDVVAFTDGDKTIYNRVKKSQDNIIVFEKEFPDTIVDTNLLPSKVITTCEFSLTVKYDDLVENYENVSFNIDAPNYVEKMTAKSDLIVAAFTQAGVTALAPAAGGDEKKAKKDAPAQAPAAGGIVAPMDLLGVDSLSLKGGSNGSVANVTAADFMGEDRGAGHRTGIQAFVDNDVVSILAAPGVTDPNVQLTLVSQCENLASRFAVLDIPRDARKVEDVIAHRDIFDSEYAALYHPWIVTYDTLDKKNIAIPPSGAVMGIYARSDNTRGVHKAPANEVVRNCVGLDCQFNKGEQDILNPKGVNLIRTFPGQGIRVWGARTVSSNGLWKYVNVRRLFIYIEESIKANTSWVVFEPNDTALWVRVQRTISVFLTGMWREGSLMGNSPEEAFFVNIGRETMSQDDIDNGRLICVIGVAPVKPAEFVIFRLTQKTSEAGE